ncbi:glycosyltransferase family 87 protein [Nocardia sp. NPDC058379]|uniref:glycosyltransferase family 87 protein n=1 Tax=unclassified Nocardia TaxID=2637762 RepID=UPI00366004EA
MTTAADSQQRAARGAARATALTFLVVLLCGLTLALAYANKARCAGGAIDESGRSLIFDVRKDSDVCYSDIQFLWLGREIDNHVFPYVDGGITEDGALTGGAVEYPVLSGVLMWAGAIGVANDADFLWHSALLLTPFALLTAWMLARLAGPAALLWAIGPPLVLYAFHNWELPVVCTAVAAVYVMTMLTGLSVRTRGIIAAVLLGLGFCLKLYPGIFVLPLAMYVLTEGAPRGPRRLRELDVAGAAQTLLAAMGTVAAVNLPFMVAGVDGWRASITFQQLRQADITTNSIWYWGHPLIFGRDAETTTTWHDMVAVASPALILASFGLAMWLGVRRWTPTSPFPWVGVSGAMLCGFMLFHKVHSPQYTLWIIPFLVLLEVPWSLVAAYLVADAAVGIGVFRYFAALGEGEGVDLMEGIVQFGVWLRTALLIALFFLFLRAALRGRRTPAPVETATAARELQPVA